MHLTLLNLTDDPIICSWDPNRKDYDKHLVLASRIPLEAKVPKRCRKLALFSQAAIKETEGWCPAMVQFSMRAGITWQRLSVEDGHPWSVYAVKMAMNHRKLIILPKRNVSAFLSDMPDMSPLYSLLLPGTHDTMAFYGWPISQCQSPSTPLAVQLQSGIRVVDIRLAVISSRLIAYHGIYPERTPFEDMQRTIYTFLIAPETCRETIVMFMKQEDFATTEPSTFSRTVHEEMSNGPGGRDMWFLENRVPTLGEVRGKVVLISRFGGNGDGWEGGLEGLGIHPTTWPDSAKDGFTWECKDTHVRTHDWYAIPSFLSIPEKFALSTEILMHPLDDQPQKTLSITFFSAASFPLATPPTVARGFGWPRWGLGVEGVNSRVGRWLLDLLSSSGDVSGHDLQNDLIKPILGVETRLRGWALMDFYSDPGHALAGLLVECNYRGRRAGEEGW
ncbi:PLC-like phosphodiesterase [Guyanagaster necrorhizus]|uniref:PLC-like phosphodiesterase n=1 Tax=Guyanagaster necrorhizus TaxID=856835 RepID=A0A9P7W6A0_9AGAR|nr:PLC-like phosphodiesterase [Guyanagaster necrorhizus MCA 3950]KAG7453029.1 PLC-like phosphodiesterase [Guyanagaster necrorhizus MCA 3950]